MSTTPPRPTNFRTVESTQPIRPRGAPRLGRGGASLKTVLVVGVIGALGLWLFSRLERSP